MNAAPWSGTWVDPLLGDTLKIVGIVLAGVVVRMLLQHMVDRICGGIADGTRELARRADKRAAAARAVAGPLLTERRAQRARTTASVLRSVVTTVVGVIVLLTVLEVLDIPVAPLLASAGIVGVAVGFGAQSLVRDVISGLFLLLEDQFGVGDAVRLESGALSGTIEAVGLRVTRLRDEDGVIWYVRNGDILRVGNLSQGWARVVLDVAVDPVEDVDRVSALLLDAAHQVRTDPAFHGDGVEDPTVPGVERITAEAVVVRLTVRVDPEAYDRVAYELRRRVAARLAADGVRLPRTGTTVVLRDPYSLGGPAAGQPSETARP